MYNLSASFSRLPWVQCRMLTGALAMAAISGCVTRPPGDTWRNRSSAPFVAGIQYAAETGNAGCETVEVYLVNPGTQAVTFTNAVLDGLALPSLDDPARRQIARRFQFDIGGRSVAAPRTVEDDPRACWWQFQPSATLAPGEAAVFQINFRNESGYSQRYPLQLFASDGTVLDVVIPRYAPDNRRITVVTWPENSDTVVIQHTGEQPPDTVCVNGREMKFRVLSPAVKGQSGAVITQGEKPFRQGQTLLIELHFGTEIRRAFCRAIPNILIDGGGWNNAERLADNIRHEYQLDDHPWLTLLPFDVACDDTRAKKHGNSAVDVIAARVKAYEHAPERLSGVDFCTALYASIWNIYAPIADAVVVKPYQLHWGAQPSRFIEREEEHIARAVNAASPRATVWIPERFKRNRHVEGGELKVLAWTALLRGVKGIRYHYWKNSADNPFEECPDLGAAMKELNAEIRNIRPILSPLIPAGKKEDRTHFLNIYQGWSGDAGVLLLVRNMRYTTDEEPNDNGKSPRFNVQNVANVPVSFTPPPWLKKARPPVDPLSGAPIPCAVSDSGAMTMTLGSLDAFQLIWIANGDASRAVKLKP